MGICSGKDQIEEFEKQTKENEGKGDSDENMEEKKSEEKYNVKIKEEKKVEEEEEEMDQEKEPEKLAEEAKIMKRTDLSKIRQFIPHANKLQMIPDLMKMNEKEIDLSNIQTTVNEESALLQRYFHATAHKLNRGKAKALIKIVEYWMKSEFKRGEGLFYLDHFLRDYTPLLEEHLEKIPELKKLHELRDTLKSLEKDFTKDDYYLTLDEQYQLTFQFYRDHVDKSWEGYWKGFDELKEETEKNALHTGDDVIDFELENEHGKMISTKELMKKGPVVVSFFRGSWCPFCVNEMCTLVDSLSRFEALGATLISIGPDQTAVKYFRKEGVLGEICIDQGNKIAGLYGLTFSCKGGIHDISAKYGIDITVYNGDDSLLLPIPATYIFLDGKIVLDHVSMEYYKRLDPSKILAKLYEIYYEKNTSTQLEELELLAIQSEPKKVKGFHHTELCVYQ